MVAEDSYADVPMLPPQPVDQSGMSMTQIVTILRAYWKLSALIVLCVILATVALVKIMPRTYTAVAQLSVNIDGGDPLGGKEFPMGMIGSYVATQIELMQSSEVLDPVIDKLNPVSYTHLTLPTIYSV